MARRPESLFERYRRRGDAAALGAVFDATAPEILRVAMHFARHPAEAEDLLQETFLTAIDRAETWDAKRRLVPWLLGILKNHARNAARKRRTAASTTDRCPPGEHSMSGRRSPVEGWMDVAWSGAVRERVEALPDPYREVLVLLLRHDRAPAEIALLLDRSPATVRSQIHRGLDRLRRSLPPEGRPRALAVLPVGAGLGGIREHVVAHAAEAATALAVSSGTLLLTLTGGLVMTKKSVAGAVLLLAVLVGGFTAWRAADRDRDRPDARPRDDTTLERGVVAPDEASPTLVGRGTAPTPGAAVGGGATAGSAASATTSATTSVAWPPDLPLPEDKGSVAGTIRFEDGTPLAGARVALWGASKITATTDARGRFHLHGEWVHDRAVFLRLGTEDAPNWVGYILSTPVVMKPGALVMRDVVLRRGRDVEGIVVDEFTGVPIAGAKVILRHKGIHEGQGSAGFLFTDEEGRFAFPYVPDGVYTIQLELDGYEPALHEVDLTVEPFRERWTMRQARPLLLRLEGLPEGAVGTEVQCSLQCTSGDEDDLFMTDARPTIQPDGTLRLDAPAPGTYLLTLYRSSHVPRVDRQIEITGGPLEPVVLRLAPGARVEGTLCDAAGSVLCDVGVSIGGAAGSPTTDAAGAFAFSWVPSGQRSVCVLVDGAWVDFGSIEVPAGGVTHVDLAAPGAAVLRGVLRVGGDPVRSSDGGLEIRDLSTRARVASAHPDGTGRFRIPMLPPGTYEVLAWSSPGIPQAREVDLGAEEEHDLGTIDLAPWVRVPVRLVLPSDASQDAVIDVTAHDAAHPLPARVPSTVRVGGNRWAQPARLTREEDGTRWVRGLAPGRHRLEFTLHGEPSRHAIVVVHVQEGMTEPVEVRFD